MSEIPCAPCSAEVPRQEWQIPLTAKQFNARRFERQLTLSYRLLPLNSRNAAQNATARSHVCLKSRQRLQRWHCDAGAAGFSTKTKTQDISNAYQTTPLKSQAVSDNDPGASAGIVLEIQAPGSVRLPAQEGRDLKLIVIHRLMHRQGR